MNSIEEIIMKSLEEIIVESLEEIIMKEKCYLEPLEKLLQKALVMPDTTPESWKGSPKVNLPSKQWCSKVNNRTQMRFPYTWTPSCTLACLPLLLYSHYRS